MARAISSGTSLNQGRYTVKGLLARGGMGAVYLAVDTKFGNRVALKENLDTTQEAQDQFHFEAQILAKLRHPCLPRVFDHFTEPSGKQYLVMDFIEGEDLQELLDKRGPLPENQVLEWMQKVCSALQYMHEQQPHAVIHRDIKPANIKLTPDGQVVLVDFGIAKAHMPGKKTVAGARGVTPGYSPPEQYGTGTDARSDLFALGATMYHLLTGRVPPESIMGQAPFGTTSAGALIPPRTLNPGLSQRTEQIILKAMALKPDRRYQTAREMEQVLAGSVVPAPPPPVLPGIPCPSCGASNRAGAQFCGTCGNPMAGAPGPVVAGVPCSKCGVSNRAGSRFCNACGNPMGAQIPPPPSPVPDGTCPSCGATADPSATFCLSCGLALGPLPATPSPGALVPVPVGPLAPVLSPTREHRIVAWTLLGAGAVVLIATFLWPGLRLLGPLVLITGFLAGLLALLSARDLLDLGSSFYYNVPPTLQILFGDPNRGRRLGAIAAALMVIVFIGQGWMILPLALVTVAGYAARTLLSEEAVRAYGGRYDRQAGVTLIGWGLTFSGIGTLPGIALLIPKPWARRGAMVALFVLAALGVVAVVIVIVLGFAEPANSSSLSREIPLSFIEGHRVRAYALTILCYALALIAGSLMGIRYLQDPSLTLVATATSARRELTVVGWILIGIALFQVVGPFVLWPTSRWGVLPRGVLLLPAVLCLAAARDLMQLFQSQYYNVQPGLRFLFGSMNRGRTLGIVAALASSAVFLGLSWLIVPLALAFLMFYVVRTLTSQPIIALCGASSTRPAGVTIIASLLLPTGIGTVAGIVMLTHEPLTPKPWARKVGIGSLAVLLAAGLLLGLLVIHQGFMVSGHSTYLSQVTTLPFARVEVPSNALTVASYALSLIVGCALAMRYMQSSSIRSYFGA